jgi:hypothetical protein
VHKISRIPNGLYKELPAPGKGELRTAALGTLVMKGGVVGGK